MKTRIRIFSSSSSSSSLSTPFPLLLLLLCSIVIVCIALIERSESAPSKDLLGISPQDEVYYKALWSSPSAAFIKCKDGSKEFCKSQLNDDFCDCPDATDEPGTSACPNGKFYCHNAGHVPLSIYSSRVNDGICDCCDGSDEYDGKIKCSNTCWEAGKAARVKLKKKIATYKQGVILRKKEVEQAKVAIAKDEAELLKLKNEEKILKGLVQQLKEHKELIEKEEEKERLQKEKEGKEKKEAEEAKREKSETVEEAGSKEKPVEDAVDDKIGVVEDTPLDQDAGKDPNDSSDEVEHVNNIENEGLRNIEVQEDAPAKEPESTVSCESGSDSLNKENDVSEDTSSLSKEELGRRVASRWTGEDVGKQATEAPDADKNDNHERSDESPEDTHSEQYEEYDSESEDDIHGYNDEEEEADDDHVEDLGEENHDDSSSSYQSVTEDDLDVSDLDLPATSDLSWLEKIQQTVRNILQAVNLFQPRVNISEGARVRKEYDESSAKLSKIQSRISSLTKKLEQDFGPEKEFFSFYKKCFEMKQNKYTYKVCPFKQATQEEGYSTTRLGNWDKFEDSYRVMVFSNGDKCWNGPDRSLKVKLRCGLENEVTDVDEPSRCEYVALLAAPAFCAEEKLKELEGKLDSMNQQQPQDHDEL